MNTEYRIRRLERTLGTLIAWSATELGTPNVTLLLDALHAPEDPNCLEGPGRTEEKIAAERRELNRVAPTPADKFAANERQTMMELLTNFAHALSMILDAHPDLRKDLHDNLFTEFKKLLP